MAKHLVCAMLLQASMIVPPLRAQVSAAPAPAQSEQSQAERRQVELEKLRLETESLQREAQYAPLKTMLAWASITQSTATVLSIIIGGWWVYLKFVRAQEKYPNIEFSADINPIGLQNGVLIVELVAYIENKGKAQHKMNGLAFDLNALAPSDPVVSDQRWGGQIHFPLEVCRGSFLPARSQFFFVDPGTKAKYSFVAGVPENTAFLLLHSYFDYVGRGKTGHTAEKTLRIQGQALGIPCPVAVATAGNDAQPS